MLSLVNCYSFAELILWQLMYFLMSPLMKGGHRHLRLLEWSKHYSEPGRLNSLGLSVALSCGPKDILDCGDLLRILVVYLQKITHGSLHTTQGRHTCIFILCQKCMKFMFIGLINKSCLSGNTLYALPILSSSHGSRWLPWDMMCSAL